MSRQSDARIPRSGQAEQKKGIGEIEMTRSYSAIARAKSVSLRGLIGSRLAVLCLSLCAVVALAGCETLGVDKSADPSTSEPVADEVYNRSLRSQVTRPERVEPETISSGTSQTDAEPFTRAPSIIGTVPSISDPTGMEFSGSGRAPRPAVRTVDAYVPALPLNEFINVVFGKMLDVPYVTGPNVANLQTVVQIRSSGEMSSRDFLALVSGALEEYGVRVVPEDGVYRILDDASLRARIPDFIKSRARLRTRSDLRPVVQFVELQAIDVASMQGFLNEAFGNSNRLSIKAITSQGYLILSGLPEDVDAAIAIIRELDELDFADSQVVRFTPKYWDVEEMTTALAAALRVEGWEVSTQVGLGRTIALLPISFSNDLFVFAKTPEARQRVQTWMREFDRPIEKGDTEQLIIYQVKNVDASELADTINSALTGGGRNFGSGQDSALGERQTGQLNGDGNINRGFGNSSGGPFTVDTMGNRLIYTGTAIEYEKISSLLDVLDSPAPEVLIEVQVAEVTLGDNLSYGVQFFDQDIVGGSDQLSVSTTGLDVGASGATVRLLSGDLDATLNAFASNRQVKVLSTPILTARSGGEAEIQVGQDVPIITSQRAANNQDGVGETDILQSVDYRATGVLLSIQPIVFSNSRIDLTISQEVSSTIDAPGSTISSPTISNRSLTTQLSLEDGQTAVLGGLIQETVVRDDQGVPILKDIPAVGNLFSKDGYSVDRTELVILITAYVLRGQADKSEFVRTLSGRINRAIADDTRMMTLKPKVF